MLSSFDGAHMCVEGCLWMLCSQRDGLHRLLGYCLSTPSSSFQTRCWDGTRAGALHLLCQLTPCWFLPRTEPESSRRAGVGRRDALCLFAHSSCLHPSINRSPSQQERFTPVSSFLCHEPHQRALQTHQYQSARAPVQKSEPSSVQRLLQASGVR